MSIPAQGAVGAETMTAGQSLDLRDLHAANIARQAEWCPDQVPDLSFRGNELGGECGEAQNVIKKLERERQGWRGSRATKDDLADELADVVICADLCAVTADIDLGAAVRRKFNATSEKQGLSVFLPSDPAVLATPRTDSDEGTADEGTEWFWRIVDSNGLGNVPSDEGEALRLLCTKAAWYDEMRSAPATPPGVPDSVREAASALLSACMTDMGPLDEADRDDEPVGMSGFGVGTAVTFGHLRRLERALSAHPAGQSTGQGDRERHLEEQLREGLAFIEMEAEAQEPGSDLYTWVKVTEQLLSESKPAPDSPLTGPVGVEHAHLISDLMDFHDALNGGVGNGAITIRCESETEQTRRNFRAVLREAAAALAARPAAPGAQGAWSFDMEAAPRDGTRILVTRESETLNRFVEIAAWRKDTYGKGHWALDGGFQHSWHRAIAWRHLDAPAPPSSGQGGR